MQSNHFIALKDAQLMTSRFRKMKEVVLNDGYQKLDVLPQCETFDRSAFDKLLANPECTKIRIYLGMDESNQVRMIVVGVNEKDEDLVKQPTYTKSLNALSSTASTTSISGEGEDGDIFENGYRCPTLCPPNSPLNS